MPDKHLPLPGELFTVEGHPAFLISPDDHPDPMPWVWYAPTLPPYPAEAERWMFERFRAAGVAVAGIDVGESHGSPEGRALYTALYDHLVRDRSCSPKPCLLARSRGGLMLMNWAAENADRVSGIAGIYPVSNIETYPRVDKAAPAYGLSEDEFRSQLDRHNPIERLAPLAQADVPIFFVHGDSDELVPLDRNSGLLASRYAELGGRVTVLVQEGEGHNMSLAFFESQPLVDFVLSVTVPD